VLVGQINSVLAWLQRSGAAFRLAMAHARRNEFAERNQLGWAVQVRRAKISRFPFARNCGLLRPSRLEPRGVSRTSRHVRRGCGGRGGIDDERCGRGRRNRMVLAPQVLGAKFVTMRAHCTDDGGKRDGSPRRVRISRKAIAQGRPVVTACTCGSRARANVLCACSPGCSGHPAFPAPSVFRGRRDQAKLGRNTPRERDRISPLLFEIRI